MRFLIKALLAATALIPAATAAMAQDTPGERARGNRPDRSGEPDAPMVVDRPVRTSGEWNRRPEPAAQALQSRPDVAQHPERQQRPWADRRPDRGSYRSVAPRGDRRSDAGSLAGRPEPRPAPPQADTAVNRPGGPGWNAQRSPQPVQRDDRRYESRRPGAGERGGWDRQPEGRFDDRGGWARQRNDRFDDRGGWNRDWRGDRRYDWSDYRTRNRSAYRLPRYYAPYGWSSGYRRFAVGATLSTLLWGENYWIDDPYAYRLPAVYGPYRWVRYYDDALLVDVRTGRVMDVVYDIFW